MRQFLGQLGPAMRASPAKSTALGSLLLVLVLLLARLALRESGTTGLVPDAGTIATAVAAPASTAIDGTSPRGSVGRAVSVETLASQPARDPFQVDWALFPALPRPLSAPADNAAHEHPQTLQDPLARFADLRLSLTVLEGGIGPGQAGCPGRAVIGDRVVTTGDALDGARVEEIGPRYVVLSDGDRRIVVRMKP